MNHIIGYIFKATRLLLASVFIFSALTKAFDPFGAQIKIEEYLNAFGVGFLSQTANIICIVQICFESLLGFLLLYKVCIKRTSTIALIVMTLFALLTFYIATTGSISDCGCFGEIVKLDNWQTLLKNIFLLLLALITRISTSRSSCEINFKTISATVLFSGLILWIAIFGYRNLPFIDATNLKTGTNIPEAMYIPENAPRDKFKTELHYRNISTGKVHKFDESDTTWWDDSKWEFVNSRSILIEKGFKPKIENFKIFDQNNEVTDSLLRLENLLVLVIRNYNAITPESTNALKSAINYAHDNNLNCLLLTSDPNVEMYSTLRLPRFRIDATTLKTLLRTNTGALFLNKGVIEMKWSINNLPDFDNFNSNLKRFVQQHSAHREVFPYILIVIFIVAIAVSHKYIANK